MIFALLFLLVYISIIGTTIYALKKSPKQEKLIFDGIHGAVRGQHKLMDTEVDLDNLREKLSNNKLI